MADSPDNSKHVKRRRLFAYGGIVASIILIAFGAASVVVGATGIDKVRDDLGREKIVGTPDSKIPGQLVDTGGEARAFAEVMRKHALEITGGQTYSEMDRFLDKQGNPTSDEAAAAKDPATGKPVENPARNVWVTQTALSTALNVAYFAESVAIFSIVMGIALLLTGIGFFVVTWYALRQPAEAPVRVGAAAAATS